MTKCINHPNRNATHDVPDDFCDLCWELWFHETLPKTEEIKQLVIENLEDTWNNYGRPKDAEQQLQELEEIYREPTMSFQEQLNELEQEIDIFNLLFAAAKKENNHTRLEKLHYHLSLLEQEKRELIDRGQEGCI